MNNLKNFKKQFEISSTSMRVTKKSIKFVDKISRDCIGSFDSTKFYTPVSKEKTEEEILELQALYKKQYECKRQTKMSDLAECNEFKTMITLTFSPEDNQSEEQVKYNWKLAKQRLEYRFGKFKYICSLERGKDTETFQNTGHLHFHIITDIKNISNHSKFWNDKKSGKKILNKKWAENDILDLIATTSNRSVELKNKRIELYNEGASFVKVLLGFGHVHIKEINEDDVKYITKYATKDKELNLKYKRTVWTSRNLEKPIKIYNHELLEFYYDYIPTQDYEYKENIILSKIGNEEKEIMRIQTLTFKDISNFYYQVQLGAYGFNSYLIELENDRKKVFDLMYPKKKKEKDFNYYYKLYGVKGGFKNGNEIKRQS